jgi:CDP-glycerol glycerophosphotransferase
MKRIISSFIIIIFYYLFRIFPINKNKIFFQNFNGKGYGDNPKYIAEEIIRRNLDFKLVWAVSPKCSGKFPKNVKTVPYKSIQAIYEEVTSKLWIDNCRKQLYVRKRKGQIYIQTWHGTVNLKKVEMDAEQNLSPYYVKQAKHDSKLADFFLSDCKFTSQLYRSSFWYNGKILEHGTPRDDILFNLNNNIKDKVFNYFNLSYNKNIILYAPTFRDNFNTDIYNLNFEQILKNLYEKTNHDWVFLIRLHPNISNESNIFTYNKTVLNASNYDDMQELLLSSDILITDYSDCMYEFAFTHKPVHLYINDYEEYKKERDFYFDIFSLPFPASKNMYELVDNINNFDYDKYKLSLNNFFDKVGIFNNGNSSKYIVDRIVKEINL